MVTRALDAAARRWPDDKDRPSKLLLDLVLEGQRAIEAREERATAARRAAIAKTSGALTGVYPEGYLEDLRKDWPE